MVGKSLTLALVSYAMRVPDSTCCVWEDEKRHPTTGGGGTFWPNLFITDGGGTACVVFTLSR